MTQFGRALHALNIDIICANSSQAKGRVERAHKTLQDRLVKELRFVGVRTFAEGNVLLPAFMADYNARFAKPPATAPAAAPDLEDAFAWKEQRRRSQALTLQYDKVLFILVPSELAVKTTSRVASSTSAMISVISQSAQKPLARALSSLARSMRLRDHAPSQQSPTVRHDSGRVR